MPFFVLTALEQLQALATRNKLAALWTALPRVRSRAQLQAQVAQSKLVSAWTAVLCLAAAEATSSLLSWTFNAFVQPLEAPGVPDLMTIMHVLGRLMNRVARRFSFSM